MKLIDLKDANGTSLQSYAETLVQKATEQKVEVVLLFLREPGELSVITGIELTELPDALSQLASLMRRQPKGRTTLEVRKNEDQTDNGSGNN